ncbi:hypothetical protein AA3271_0920 [Gluconobacter japonicus NBRC 3271]|nr:hypothetical protein AA3271_0920 [Gluconobacter japonicus NBRC 3271]
MSHRQAGTFFLTGRTGVCRPSLFLLKNQVLKLLAGQKTIIDPGRCANSDKNWSQNKQGGDKANNNNNPKRHDVFSQPKKETFTHGSTFATVPAYI